MSDDRTVHARLRDGAEIVRYDRAGKWYLELAVTGLKQSITIGEAAFFATGRGAQVFTGLSGGTQFDARVRAKVSEGAAV